MKLLTLNLWGGIVYEPLMKFIEEHAVDTDIFCFQEMLFGDKPEFTPESKARENLFAEIALRLSDFVAYKNPSPSIYFQDELVSFPMGQAIFVRKNIEVKNYGGFLCYDDLPIGAEDGGKNTGVLQWIDLCINRQEITIASLHGLWQLGTSKKDTPERFFQSQKIKEFLNKKQGQKIICGDFNLAVDGKSLEMLEEGMRNLVKESGVQSTRSEFYPKPDKFADYILVSLDIEVKNFIVLQDPVSDHLPLVLEFK